MPKSTPPTDPTLENLLTELGHHYWRGRRRAARALQAELLLTYRRLGATLSEVDRPTDRLRLGHELSARYGPHFGAEQLDRFVRLYYYYAEAPPPPDLGWTHYHCLLDLPSGLERHFYQELAVQRQWTVAELRRQIASDLYHRPDRLEIPGRKARAVQPEELLAEPELMAFLGWSPGVRG